MLSGCNCSHNAPEAKTEEIKSSNLRVINVLDKDLFDDCRIKGSVNVPFMDQDDPDKSPIEGYAKDLPKDTILSFAQAGVNGADVAVNLVPIFDKYFAATNPNYKSNDHLKYKMKDWSDALDGVRKDLKNKQAENNKALHMGVILLKCEEYVLHLWR